MPTNTFKPVLYGTGCPLCNQAKKLLTASNIEVNYISEMSIVMSIAITYNITSLPIFEYAKNEFKCGQEAINYIRRSYTT